MPKATDLPGDLMPLVRRNTLPLRHVNFQDDLEGLLSALEPQLEAKRTEQTMLPAPNVIAIDYAVRELLQRELPSGLAEQVQITFARPDADFPPASVTLPAIDLFLYDIQQRPTRVDYYYMITAWASESVPDPTLDEHHLIGEISTALNQRPIFAVPLGDTTEPSLVLTIYPTRLENVADMWQSLGGRRRLALAYKVSINLRRSRRES